MKDLSTNNLYYLEREQNNDFMFFYISPPHSSSEEGPKIKAETAILNYSFIWNGHHWNNSVAIV